MLLSSACRYKLTLLSHRQWIEKKRVVSCATSFRGQGLKWYIIFPSTFHWPWLSYMTPSNCKEGWEMKTSFVLFTEYLSNKNNLELKWDSEAWFSVSKDVIKDFGSSWSAKDSHYFLFSYSGLELMQIWMAVV